MATIVIIDLLLHQSIIEITPRQLNVFINENRTDRRDP